MLPAIRRQQVEQNVRLGAAEYDNVYQSMISATAIRSLIWVSRRAKATAISPLSTRRSEFRRAANAADEVDALVAAQVADAEDGFEQLVGQQADVEPAHRVRDGNQRRVDLQPVPTPAEVHADDAGLVRMHGGRRRRYGETLTEAGEEFGRRQAIQVAHDAVVVEDAHLVRGKDDRQETWALACPAAAGGDAARTRRRAERWWPSAIYRVGMTLNSRAQAGEG